MAYHSEARAGVQTSFQDVDRIKRWWRRGNELQDDPGPSSYGVDTYDMALREEIEELESRAVGTWISCTKLVLEGEANCELRATVKGTFESMEAMKLRALY